MTREQFWISPGTETEDTEDQAEIYFLLNCYDVWSASDLSDRACAPRPVAE